MKKYVLSLIAVSVIFTGCATVPTSNTETATSSLKQFNTPDANMAGLYVYRKEGMGSALKKYIWVDDNCLGNSVPNVFFYKQVAGNTEHKVTTQTEFGTNDLLINTMAGQNYFVKQYIKPGLLVGGANLKLMSAEQGMADIAKLQLANNSGCGDMLNN